MTRHFLALPVLALAACGHASPPNPALAAPATNVAPGDWPTFNRTLAGNRYSPLAEIDRSNVARLIGVAAGMKSPIWPGGSAASQIVVYGLR